eukprot:CAMPEP_0184870550 /NCGR_PEP_ID=MMETSP0580-20130426/37877_1 /TAXON_ID=1118495 /ORGANISM="Dactyliosolen fragilissimus" /LENGTH=1086 /DNA_ID=CAMNT_0027372677 /DNA_START=39 /DNA_END=3299 /DNA_ORIENTATION=+
MNAEGLPMRNGATEAAPDPNAILRFEDLTIDDDLSLLDRVVRYAHSGIALQRLVHVKMIAETARSVGTVMTIKNIIPLLPALVADAESIIRQHVATQLLPLSLSCMFGNSTKIDHKSKPKPRKYNDIGYKVVTNTILNHMNILIVDPDMEVRKAASDSLATLALHLRPEDIGAMILPIPLRLGHQTDSNSSKTHNHYHHHHHHSNSRSLSSYNEDLRVTSANLLGDIASLDSSQIPCKLVASSITPAIIVLCQDKAFRVRRAAVQALPRVVSGSAADDVHHNLLPAFVKLSKDDMYRVRKSVGECLVDMSRSLMLVAKAGSNMSTLSVPSKNHSKHNQLIVQNTLITTANEDMPDDEKYHQPNEFLHLSKPQLKEVIMDMRRKTLLPICTQFLSDTNKFVRHGMMQFLGPFIASFYPLEGAASIQQNVGIVEDMNTSRSHAYDQASIIQLLRDYSDADTFGSNDENYESSKKINVIGGMGLQFFPHANGMVSRLNPSIVTSLTAARSSQEPPAADSEEFLLSCIPSFLHKAHNDHKSILHILHHKQKNTPSQADVDAVSEHLLGPYVDLASIALNDENLDAEMRVYCAYSLPAVLLLLGVDGWNHSLKNCFFTLIRGNTTTSNETEGTKNGTQANVPIPVKRCLASSFHTICHILGPQALTSLSSPLGQKLSNEMLAIFESHFLRDSDDTVRLNVIRNLPSFLSILDTSLRCSYLPILNEIITGESMLGASKRRSASNPILLNWRQREMIAQILPNLIMLFKPSQVRTYLWPIVKILMADSVNVVRENVEWSICILFRVYEAKNCRKEVEEISADIRMSEQSKDKEAAVFSADACGEVLSHLKTFLFESKLNMIKNTNKSIVKRAQAGPFKDGEFSTRQGFCRIITTISLLLRLGSGDRTRMRSRKAVVHSKSEISAHIPHAFQNLNSDEYRHIHHVLRNYLLPPALEMKDDRVSNVRLNLLKSLRLMPPDIRDHGEVRVILQTLEDEIETWEGGGGMYLDAKMEEMNIPNIVHSKQSTRDGQSKVKISGAIRRHDDLTDKNTIDKENDKISRNHVCQSSVKNNEMKRKAVKRQVSIDGNSTLASV